MAFMRWTAESWSREMWIERIHIRGFGCLRDRVYEFPENKAVLVLEDNERGKSTLAAAILSCLCGLPKHKRAGEKIKLSDVYKPWEGDAYAVEMDLRAGSGAYHVERDFGRGGFVVRDTETGRDITPHCDRDLARQFLHLPREDFARLAMIRGKEVHHFDGSTTIQGRLSAVVEGAENSGGDAAIAALDGVNYTLGGRQIKTETAMKRLSEKTAEKQARMRTLDESLAQAGSDAAAMDEARERSARLAETLSALDVEFKSARLTEAQERIAAEESRAEEIACLTAEMNELEHYASFPAERGTQLEGAIARADERRRQCKELADRMESLQREADQTRSRIDAQDRFANATTEDTEALRSCEDSMRIAVETSSKKREAVELERRALANEGVDLDASSGQWQGFERLAARDREFLKSCRETELELGSDLREREDFAGKCEAGLGEIKRARRKLGAWGKALLAAGGLCGLTSIVLMVMLISPIVPSLLLTFVGIGTVIAGAVQITRAGGLRADDKARLERELDEAQAGVKSAKERHEEMDRRIEQVADSIPCDPASLIDEFREYERAMGRSETLGQINAQLSQAEESLESARARASAALNRLGISLGPDDDLIEALAREREALSRFIGDRNKLARLEQDIAAKGREIENSRAGMIEEQNIARAILNDAGIDGALPPDEGLKAFGEAERKYRRFREIKDSLLPTVSGRAVSSETLSALKAEHKEMEEALAGSGVESGRGSSEVESERMAARRALNEVAAEVRELERRVGARVDAYRSEYPILREELQSLEREMARVERFGDAIRTAAEVMREVSRESRTKWASALNASASAILPSLNGDYDTPRFDESLSFTIRRVSNGKVIDRDQVDAYLSTGAKDQVYLAARLACCDELSRAGEPIPIILDDPLIAADDERFRSGFAYLAGELPKRHQVIVLSCHKSRHARLLREAWFAENVTVLTL